MHKLIWLTLLSCIFLFPHNINADNAITSSPLICSLIKVVECDMDAGCIGDEPDNMGLPQFVKIDIENKKIMTVKDVPEKRESIIRTLESSNGKMFLQGLDKDKGRAWTIVISENTGEMSATISEEQFGFIVFGRCTSL